MPRGRPAKESKDVLIKSAEFIGWALGGLEREITQTRERLASLNAEAVKLRERIAGGTAAAPPAPPAPPAEDVEETPKLGRRQRRRQMSPDARKRISEMMKKRWAERRKSKN